MGYLVAFLLHPFTFISLFLSLFLMRRRIGATAKFVLFNILSLFIFGALFDVIAASLHIAKDNLFRCDNQVYHHGLKPYQDQMTRWGFSEPYRAATNSLGMLDKEPREVALKAPGRRIVIAGDSFVEGVGYPYEKTIPGIIAERLGAQGIEVLNAGTVSYSPKLYYLRFKHLLEQGFTAHDLYLLIDIGDIQDEVVYAYFAPDGTPLPTVVERSRLFFYQHSFLFRMLWDRLVIRTENPRSEFSPFWGGLGEYYRVRPLWTHDEKEFERWGKEGLASALDYTDRLWRLLKEHGITLHISVHPWREQILRHEIPCRQQEVWRSFCAERGIEFIDFFPLFINDLPPEEVFSRYFIPDDIHWNETGLRMVAEELLRTIEKSLERPSESRPKREV